MRLALKEIKNLTSGSRSKTYTNDYALSYTKPTSGVRTEIRAQETNKTPSNDSNESILREAKSGSAIYRTQEITINHHHGRDDVEAQRVGRS